MKVGSNENAILKKENENNIKKKMKMIGKIVEMEDREKE